MKVYIIDNIRKLKKIKKELEEDFVVESKENCNFKMTKNDYAIISDEEGSLEGIDKLKNIIFITNNKEYKYIWKIANELKTADIIDINLDELYISNRIKKLVGS